MSSQHIVVENEHSDIIEAFIKNNHPMVSHPSISNCYINDMLDSWEHIKCDKISSGSHIWFAQSTQGLIEYGFYKSNNGIIYGLITYCGTLSNYFLTEDWYELTQKKTQIN
jgi:hypothetical protein